MDVIVTAVKIVVVVCIVALVLTGVGYLIGGIVEECQLERQRLKAKRETIKADG